jgi:hypothetical protein
MEDINKRFATALILAAEFDQRLAKETGGKEHADAASVKKRMAEWILIQPAENKDLRQLGMLANTTDVFVGGKATGRLLMSIGRLESHDSVNAFAQILHQIALVATDDEIDETISRFDP